MIQLHHLCRIGDDEASAPLESSFFCRKRASIQLQEDDGSVAVDGGHLSVLFDSSGGVHSAGAQGPAVTLQKFEVPSLVEGDSPTRMGHRPHEGLAVLSVSLDDKSAGDGLDHCALRVHSRDGSVLRSSARQGESSSQPGLLGRVPRQTTAGGGDGPSSPRPECASRARPRQWVRPR